MSYAEYKINEKGELLVRGQVIAKYIIEDGKKTVTDKNEWFNTRDLAECRNGKYYILGRADDLIVASNGENLNPNLIEPLLRAGAEGVCPFFGVEAVIGDVPVMPPPLEDGQTSPEQGGQTDDEKIERA